MNGKKFAESLKLGLDDAEKIIGLSLILLSSFVLALGAAISFIKVRDSGAVTGLQLVGAPYITTGSNVSTVSMDIVPSISNDVIASGSHSLTVATNAPTGYTLSINTVSSSTNLAPVAGTGNIAAIGNGTSVATPATPITLTKNTWGYAINKVSTATSSNQVINGFDTPYSVPTPSSASKWAGVPASGATNTLRRTAESTSSDTTTLYYGAKVDASIAATTYTGGVVYSATTNTSSAYIPTPTIISVSPSSGPMAGGTAIQIVGTGFTVNNQSVSTAVTIGGAACTNVTISSNTPTTSQDTIYCTTPASSTAGAKDVAVTTWNSTVTGAGGYNYIAPANVTFVSPSMASTIAGTESGPAFTIVGTGFTGATAVTIGGTSCASYEVVSDTHIFCKAPNTINTTGSKAIVVTKSGIASNSTTAVTYSSTAYPTLQATNAFSQCTATAKIFRDTRDSQLYYVKKMEDGKCWMVDNLKYANYGELAASGYLTADGTNTQSASNYDSAKYTDSGASDYCAGSANMPASTSTRCGLLYNWYAATGGTGTYSKTGDSLAESSVCPGQFRLPTGNTGTANANTLGDFGVLDQAMGGTGAAQATEIATARWLWGGSWGGVHSGYWNGVLTNAGSGGYYWSSMAASNVNTYFLRFYNLSVDPGTVNGVKRYGFAVRCVMEDPAPTITSISPTTNWTGGDIYITGNNLSGVIGVTVGGTACQNYDIVSSTTLRCVLPAKDTGTVNAVQIIGVYGGNAMNVTYDGANKGNMQSFTAATCSNMPVGLAQVWTDSRNSQIYRVKKMDDGKCWMIDNLKYAFGTNMTNTADVTTYTGMAYYVDPSDINYASDSGSYCLDSSGTLAATGSTSGCGYLYNWFGATYGTGTTSISTRGKNATGSICPSTPMSGLLSSSPWKLPTGAASETGTNDYALLNGMMANQGVESTNGVYYTNWLSSGSFSGVFSGLRAATWSSGQGSWGYYWSSTANSTNDALPAFVDQANISPGTVVISKYAGLAVRCVVAP